MTCSISDGERNGWRALRLQNDLIAVVVLPGKGADITSLRHLPSGVEALMQAPWGLPRRGSAGSDGAQGRRFLAHYQGAWQELFPNTNHRVELAGVGELPFHGEVATAAWDVVGMQQDASCAEVVLRTHSERLPLSLERRMRLTDGEAKMWLHEEVRCTGDSEVSFVWGHHCVVGAPLVAPGSRVRLAGGRVRTPVEPEDSAHRLASGQSTAWPHARGEDGQTIDISVIPPTDPASHDDIFVDDMVEGSVRVENDALGLCFQLQWDLDVFRTMVFWQPLGGVEAPVLRGLYGVGIEPWVFGGNLAEAIEAGRALRLCGGQTLQTALAAGFEGLKR
ncbi:MAG: DUF4432 family protein [Solirubrobacteraceae bacterium]